MGRGMTWAGSGVEGGCGRGGGQEVVQDVNREGRPLSSSSVAEQLPGRAGAGGSGEHPTVTRYQSNANPS